MTRRYDSYAHMLEFARLRAAEAASESVQPTDAELMRHAMDSARTDVEYARGQIARVIRRFGPVCELVRASDGLERAISELTPTATVPTADIFEWATQQLLDREG